MSKVIPFELLKSKEKIGVVLYSGFPQNNFLADLEFASDCYQSYGIPKENIFCFIPPGSISGTSSDSDRSKLPEKTRVVIDHNEFFTRLEDHLSSYKYLFFIFTGHGNQYGVADASGKNNIKLFPLLNLLDKLHHS